MNARLCFMFMKASRKKNGNSVGLLDHKVMLITHNLLTDYAYFTVHSAGAGPNGQPWPTAVEGGPCRDHVGVHGCR